MTITNTGRRTVAGVLCAALLSGCVSTGSRLAPTPVTGAGGEQATAATAAIAEYAQKLPPGTRVRVDRTTGGRLTGTLLKATDQLLVVQRSTRHPEPPVEIPMREVTRVELYSGRAGSVGKAVAAGAAAGLGAALGFYLIIVTIFDD